MPPHSVRVAGSNPAQSTIGDESTVKAPGKGAKP